MGAQRGILCASADTPVYGTAVPELQQSLVAIKNTLKPRFIFMEGVFCYSDYMKTLWNFGLLYKNEKDPQIEKDMVSIERAYASFEKKYKNADFTATPETLAKALSDFEKLIDATIWKPYAYFALRSDVDTNNTTISSMLTRIEQRLTVASNKTIFFNLHIAAIPKEKHTAYVNHELLKPYAYMLKKIFSNAKYRLSEKEEQLESLLSQPGYTMWVDGQERVVSNVVVLFEGEYISLSEAVGIIPDLPTEKRRELQSALNAVLRNSSSFAESEINAIFNYKKIMDEQRGYKKPYSSTVLGYENDEKEVEMLTSLVTKYFSLSQRFFALHTKLLGEKKSLYADRSSKIGTLTIPFSFDKAVEQVKKSFSSFDPAYADLLDSYLKNGQIDVAPKVGKRGGAYCWGYGMLPVFVLLNHTDDIRSVETIAHEMGHAIHSEAIRALPAHYRRYSTATAEVASTFFEQLVIDDIASTLPDDQKIILLHNKLLGDMATIFRQVACFNFENELHQKVRAEGSVSADVMAGAMQKHLQSYLGKSFTVSKDDGYTFVSWGHIRRPFYVYTYAYGQIVSRALFEEFRKDTRFADKVKKFLATGGALSPKDTFKSVGITLNEKFFETGIKSIERDVDTLETLSKAWLKKNK